MARQLAGNTVITAGAGAASGSEKATPTGLPTAVLYNDKSGVKGALDSAKSSVVFSGKMSGDELKGSMERMVWSPDELREAPTSMADTSNNQLMSSARLIKNKSNHESQRDWAAHKVVPIESCADGRSSAHESCNIEDKFATADNQRERSHLSHRKLSH